MFTPNVILQFSHQLPMLQSIISQGKTWLSEAYVNRFLIQQLLQELKAEKSVTTDWSKRQVVFNVAMLETWLRYLDLSPTQL